jgi:hypothetical protein
VSTPTDEPNRTARGGVMLAVLICVIVLSPVMAGAIGLVVWLLFGGD